MSLFPEHLPDPRRPDPRSVPALCWGVLGTGWIAQRFVASLHEHTDQRVVAVGSRTAEAAARFAQAAGIATAHGSAEELVGDPAVDVVYVATPHQAHRAGALLAVLAGKHVLVEKPLALDAPEARGVLDAASAAGVVCLEALWTLFLPRFDVVRQLLEDGRLGEVRTVIADHGERFDPPHRILDPRQAGGSLLDLGSYLTALATWVLGPAQTIHAVGETTSTGVNGQTAAVLTHAGGATSSLHTTILGRTPTSAALVGPEATLFLPGPFFMPGDVVVTSADGCRSATWRDPADIGHAALFHSAVELAHRVAVGEAESPLHPGSAVLDNLTVLDEITRQVGVDYSAAR